MAKIGSARIDENGNISGGKAGNQNGRELAIEEFYFHKKGWLAFKPKDKEHAKALAKAMVDACNNKNIGYDQGERLGVYKWVNGGTRIAAIKNPCECDCSALVRACILEATGRNLANFNTASEADVLKKSGLFEPPYEINAVKQLEVGMVLVTKTKGHTVIVVEANEPTGENEAPKMEAGKLQPSKYRDLALRGEYMPIKKDIALRYGAGNDAPMICELPYGAKLSCYGYYNLYNGEKWLAVAYAGRTGYCRQSEIVR